MFQKIARLNLDNGWAVELGYEVPAVIDQGTKIDVTTKIIYNESDQELDLESAGYKQSQSVAEVLKIGFDIGCSYTTKVFEQINKMGDKLVNHPEGVDSVPGEITGTTSQLVTE